MNNHNILELSHEATIDEIKKAYYRLAIKWHPDKNNHPDAEDKFKQISEAYQTLTSRILYHTSDNSLNEVSSEFISPEDLFESLFTPLGNPFENFSFEGFFETFFGKSYNKDEFSASALNETTIQLYRDSIRYDNYPIIKSNRTNVTNRTNF